MATKSVKLSTNGTDWFTLPGNTAELRNEAGEISDTIFGQDFQSSESGLIGWNISANALYKGFAGYVAKIKITGTSTQMTNEAMSVETGKTYKITATAKQIIDPSKTVTVKANGIAVTADKIANIDYLYGRVTFDSGYTPAAPITMDANYLPVSAYCGFNSFTLTQTAESIDITDMCTAQDNNGHRVFDYGLKTVSFEASGMFSQVNANRAKLLARDTLLIEIGPDGQDRSVARGFFRMVSQGQSGGVGALEEESVSFNLNVPDAQLLKLPFSWNHSGASTLNQGVRKALDAWEGKTPIHAQYLHDGVNGVKGQAIVTEMTLSGGLEVMNEFSVALQGTDQLTAVP